MEMGVPNEVAVSIFLHCVCQVSHQMLCVYWQKKTNAHRVHKIIQA